MKLVVASALLILLTALFPLIEAEALLVPEWVKGVAGFWAEGKISDQEFVNAIKFLINEGIIVLDSQSQVPETQSEVTLSSNTQIENTVITSMPFDETSKDYSDNNPEIMEIALDYGKNKITNQQFLDQIQAKINSGLIKPFTGPVTDNSAQPIPDWIKNNANWYGEQMIDNYNFYEGLKWLYANGYLNNP